MLCMLGVFLASVAVFINLLFIVTVHRKTNVPVNLYWDNKYADCDTAANLKRKRKPALSFIRSLPHMVRLMHVG